MYYIEVACTTTRWSRLDDKRASWTAGPEHHAGALTGTNAERSFCGEGCARAVSSPLN